jgi:hypothetical protein
MVRKWTPTERSKLIKGINKHGIGNWTAIRDEFLPAWVRKWLIAFIILILILMDLSDLLASTFQTNNPGNRRNQDQNTAIDGPPISRRVHRSSVERR